ncbi:YihY/virulence factor BrkB family protein [Tamlana sp. 2_MG-2023]|uniref:YihY/virulence factor BrkB family protein n=1 Tax=unclassified Tamlana TaxID=2614803 RepID=UPI0026E3D6F4|nr:MULTISPECIES: YihY/virulence factor BrkB family protein [unclassified Tamlana]MDO6760394.1 YihY/virulence factor BrkB family protein [Tamlana sp. 2_MG-2023]MDO6789907.1 YihY/virulence factor BrkB family protein [Tamlana sp. 1_MG-2023]
MTQTRATNNTFKIKDLPSLIVETYKNWSADDPFRLSAVVAYYAVLSMPGLLVIIVNLVGSVWGAEIVQGQLTSEISSALGHDAADSIRTMMIETQNKEKSTMATIIGVATLLFGATGVFYHLQLSLNQIWDIDPNNKSGFTKMLLDRTRSFAFILVIGFLLLISFLVTTAISSLNNYIQSIFPEFVVYIAFVFDVLVSISIITVLFALIFRYLPDVRIRWKTVWVGGLITAILFVFGEFLLGLYLGKANPGSTYGAAGTIVLILLWVSYSCLILFFGAEFTYVYAKRYGHGIPDGK